MSQSTLKPHELAILLDLTKKAEADVLAALDRTLNIAPVEARPSITFHVAFSLCSYSALMVERIRANAAGEDVPPLVVKGVVDPQYLRTLRALLGAFNMAPDMAAVDRSIATILESTGVNTRSPGKP